MKRFVIRLFLFAMLFLGYVFTTHVWCWWKLSKRIDSTYTLRPDQKFLFIGSSTLGCSVVESSVYSNKVLWVPASPLDTTFMKLAELERRGQLSHVNVLALPFNVQMLTLFTEKDVMWSWYQELPVAWRHFAQFPFGRVSLLKYILSNLRPSVPFKVQGEPSGEMDVALMDKSYADRLAFLGVIRNEFCDIDLSKNYQGWEMRFKNNIFRMLEICHRNHIRPVVYRQPLLQFYKEHLPPNVFVVEKEWIDYFRTAGFIYIDIPEVYGQDVLHDHIHMTKKGAEAFMRDLFPRLQIFD